VVSIIFQILSDRNTAQDFLIFTATQHPTNGSCWFFKVLPTKRTTPSLGIPPTAVGGLLKSYLQRERHPVWNSTNGSWWFFKVRTYKENDTQFGNSTNGSWWSFKVLPTKRERHRVWNSTNGSWWFFKVPTYKENDIQFGNSTNGSWW